MKSNDDNVKKFNREKILKSALKELDEAKIRCDIPSLIFKCKKALSITMELF